MRNIQSCLEAANSSLDKIVRRRIYIIDIKQFREVDAIWAEWVGPPYPVSTCVQVSQPPLSSFDIEGCLCGGDNC